MTNNPLDEARQVHLMTLASQKEMRKLSSWRDRAVRAANAAGHSTREIAGHLGITQRRVQAMIRNANKGTAK